MPPGEVSETCWLAAQEQQKTGIRSAEDVEVADICLGATPDQPCGVAGL